MPGESLHLNWERLENSKGRTAVLLILLFRLCVVFLSSTYNVAYKGLIKKNLSRWLCPEVPHLFLDLICNCWISWATQWQPKTSQLWLCCIPQQCSIFRCCWKLQSWSPICKTQPLGVELENNLCGTKLIWLGIALCESKQRGNGSPPYAQAHSLYPQNMVPMSRLPTGNNPWHLVPPELCLGVVWAVLLGMGQNHAKGSANSWKLI